MMPAPRAFVFQVLAIGCLSCIAHTSLPDRGDIRIRPLSYNMREFRLPSGLHVVVEEDRGAAVVAVVSVVGAGSTSDDPGKEGLAHLVEHLTFRARPTGSMTTWTMLARAGAADLNGMTGFDQTTYYEAGGAESLSFFLRLEATRLAHPLAGVDERTFNVEREVVRNE